MRRANLSSRQVIAASGTLCAAALACTGILVASGSSAAAATPSCASSGLVVWLDTNGNGTAGSIYYNLEFTNLSRHACTLVGYPGVSGVNLAGHQLGSAASRNNAHGSSVITLAGATIANTAGATPTVVLRIVEADNFPMSSCRQVNAGGLRVYPPGQTASKLVPFPFRACSRSGPGYLSVEAVQKGIITNG